MRRMQSILSASSSILLLASATLVAQESPVISYQDGRLLYHPNERGDRVPDFSHCGYAGANERIPDAPVRVVVEPKPGDNTERIQKAIDYVGGLPADANGVRGAVLLLKGRHEVLGGLTITKSGVVLRGQGMDEDGTTLVAAGLDRRTLVRIQGESDVARQTRRIEIIDDYVPVGAVRFRVEDAAGLMPGSKAFITRPSTKEWIERLGMADFGGREGGFTWKPGSRDIVWDREVKSVEGDRVTVNAPLTTALDREYGGGYLTTYEWPGRIRRVGVENIRLESTFEVGDLKDEDHAWCAITLENACDAWVRQVAFRHFAGSAVAVHESCKQVTVRDCLSFAPVSENGGYRRNAFFNMGQQTLFLRCYSEFGRHDFSLGHCAAGPNAFVQCEARLPFADSGPIDSWASGALFDNVSIDGNALSLTHRGRRGQGAAWSAANSVLWQCNAAVARCFNPPTAQNWAFGTWAEFEGDGVWRDSNDFVSPDSLYAAQLQDRLGADASDRLRLMPRSHGSFTNPSLDLAQEMAAASRVAAPLLSDYILDAARRDPLPIDPTEAKSVDELPQSQTVNRARTSRLLAITNGWLTIDGKLLIGGVAGITWWRGSMRPDEAPDFGVNVTRYVPGRTGRGFTDDLEEVTDFMVSEGKAAFDHHHGLWYDRRRDDHQRVRRMDGDVWPPFYEQPFARGGKGTAWDGLSKYDLTRFNPWYWSRLRQFADLCQERGLVLFHQNYFQHNILEAGAHWADFPWRTANNINQTEFPEPPPYAGDKRIFMAELFYDANHPARRDLHTQYIRQCLNNFTNHANVIQFTGAEFTGPLAFMEFWLDTVAQWRSEKGRDALVALSCTKDVQDAVLADPNRSAVVDLVDFWYWWRTDRGEFAPPGGKNLAPRQFERRWRGGRPNDEDLAGMASEYRARYPDKPLISRFDSAGWAWLCAGGSMPRLPRTTDERLLAAIPRMRPWSAASEEGAWILREPGKQYLVYGGGQLDLSAESGSFRVNGIDPRTGKVEAGESVTAGGRVQLPKATVVWMIKE